MGCQQGGQLGFEAGYITGQAFLIDGCQNPTESLKALN